MNALAPDACVVSGGAARLRAVRMEKGNKETETSETPLVDYRPSLATDPGRRYFDANFELIRFIAFIAQMASRNDEVQKIASDALRQFGDDNGDQESEVSPNKMTEALAEYRRLMAEVVLSRAVDNLLTYITELLSLVYAERPETLRSKEQVQVDFILGFESMEELQSAIAERRVERLSYSGIKDLVDWVNKSLGFVLIPDHEQLAAIERFVQQRNLIVHNRGVVDRRYVRAQGTVDGVAGHPLNVGGEAVVSMTLMGTAVSDMDGRAAEKWDLPRSPYPTEEKT